MNRTDQIINTYLSHVVDRFLFRSGQMRAENPVVAEAARKMCEVEIISNLCIIHIFCGRKQPVPIEQQEPVIIADILFHKGTNGIAFSKFAPLQIKLCF